MLSFLLLQHQPQCSFLFTSSSELSPAYGIAAGGYLAIAGGRLAEAGGDLAGAGEWLARAGGDLAGAGAQSAEARGDCRNSSPLQTQGEGRTGVKKRYGHHAAVCHGRRHCLAQKLGGWFRISP